METVDLATIIAQPEVSSIISRFTETFDTPLAVKDEDFNILLGVEPDNLTDFFPIECEDTILGWVSGEKQASSLLASIISYAADRVYKNQILLRDMAERRDYEEALRASEEKYRLHFNQVADVVYSIDADFKIVTLSPSVEQVMGYTPAELMGKPFAELNILKGESLERAIFDTARIFNGEKVPLAEYELITKDGRVKIGEIRNTPVYRDGKVVSIISVARDITERKNTERRLEESELRFRTMAETITNGLIIMEKGKMVYVNDRACEICGYPREELMSIWGPDLTIPEESLHKEETIQKVRNNGVYPDHVDTWIQRKDGSKCCINLRFSFSYQQQREYAGYVIITDITEQKTAQEQLQAAKSFIDNVIESSLDAIIVTDTKGYIARVNRYFLELLGYAQEEVLGKHVSCFSILDSGTYDTVAGATIELDGAYVAKQQEMFLQLRENRKVLNWDIYLAHKNKRLIPTELNISYLYDDKGERTGAVGILRDSTERQKARDALQETLSFLDNIIESSLDAIVVSDTKGFLNRANKSFYALTGYTKEEVCGKRMPEFTVIMEGTYESTTGEVIEIDSKYVDYTVSMVSRFVSEGKIAGWESYLIRKDNKVIPVDVNIVYLLDKEGVRAGTVGILRDATERKKAEKQIVEARNFLEDIITTSADGIMVTDSSSTITMVNKAAEGILGYTRHELMGRKTQEFIPKGGEIEERGKLIQKELYAMGSLYNYEHRWLRKGGELIDVELSIALLKDSLGVITGSVVCMRDVSERKASERKLFEYQNQLRCLTSQLTLTEEQERRRIAANLHDRIGQSLALSKIKLGAFGAYVSSPDMEKDLADIRALLDQSIQDTRSLIFDLCPPFLYELGLEKALEWLLEDIEQHYNLRTHLEWENKPAGRFDDDVRILLYQSIRELLINVVKHARAKTAKVSLHHDDQHILISVEDDGKGFLLNPQGPMIGREGGFGLFRIRERFQHLGGAMSVESRLRHGTKIYLRLPLEHDTPHTENLL